MFLRSKYSAYGCMLGCHDCVLQACFWCCSTLARTSGVTRASNVRGALLHLLMLLVVRSLQSSAFALKRASASTTVGATMSDVASELESRREWIVACTQQGRKHGDPASDHLAKHLVTLTEVRAVDSLWRLLFVCGAPDTIRVVGGGRVHVR